jgi:hypothetical protein
VYHLIQTEGGAPAVDNTEYELIVCLNGEQAIFQGLVTNAYITNGFTRFDESSGLKRAIQGATCILTVGTQAEFKAAEELTNAANTEEVPSVDETQSGS